MQPIQKVLFPTDFSPTAEKAFCFAVAVARAAGATLTVLHVQEIPNWTSPQPPPEATAEIKARIEQRFDAYRIQAGDAALTIEFQTVGGRRPSSVIPAVAETIGADLLVMGDKGTSGIKRLFHGSTTGRVLRQVHIPILWIHTTHTPPDHWQTVMKGEPLFSHILAAVDGSECSLWALQTAFAWWGGQETQKTVLHIVEELCHTGFDVGMVFPFPELYTERLDQARISIEKLLSALPDGVAPDRCLFRSGMPSLEILDTSQDEKASLIVMGAWGTDVTTVGQVGSVTDRVVHHADCPVLTVPRPQSR